jgi:hypothetical protein
MRFARLLHPSLVVAVWTCAGCTKADRASDAAIATEDPGSVAEVDGAPSGGIANQSNSAAQPAGKALRDALAEEFALGSTIQIDAKASSAVISQDGKQLAYIRDTGARAGSTIVISTLPPSSRVKEILLNTSVKRIQWSPDASKLIAVGNHAHTVGDQAHIIMVADSEVLPLGSVPEGLSTSEEILWVADDDVYFFKNHILVKYDLTTLSVTYTQSGVQEQLKQLRVTAADHPNVVLGLTRIRAARFPYYTGAIGVWNRDGSYHNVLYTGPFTAATFAADASYAVLENDGQLHVLSLVARSRPALNVEALLEALPHPVEARDTAELRARLEAGYPVYAHVFRPRVNPLNDRVVGADGESKGRVQIKQVRPDGSLSGHFVDETTGTPAAGDVLRLFVVIDQVQRELKSLNAVIQRIEQP